MNVLKIKAEYTSEVSLQSVKEMTIIKPTAATKKAIRDAVASTEMFKIEINDKASGEWVSSFCHEIFSVSYSDFHNTAFLSLSK